MSAKKESPAVCPVTITDQTEAARRAAQRSAQRAAKAAADQDRQLERLRAGVAHLEGVIHRRKAREAKAAEAAAYEEALQARAKVRAQITAVSLPQAGRPAREKRT
jgi:hypothetical protein